MLQVGWGGRKKGWQKIWVGAYGGDRQYWGFKHVSIVFFEPEPT